MGNKMKRFLIVIFMLFFESYGFSLPKADKDLEKRLTDALTAKVKLAKQMANSGNNKLEILMTEIYHDLKALEKIKKPIVNRAYKFSSFKSSTFVKPPKIPIFTGWDFSRGNNWLDKFWKTSSCGEDRCCQFWAGSLICMGAIPCYPLQCLLSPCIPGYYKDGSCCQVGCPLESETDLELVTSYLDMLEGVLDSNQVIVVEGELVQSNPPPSAPTNEQITRT